MDNSDPLMSESELVSPDEPTFPTLEVQVATVSVVDGIWQDQPDNVAAFVEARLGELARGRGNLYICLDVSGEVEGRSELERALIEVIRDTYANSRGSISFALSEALRAANSYIYDSNRQVSREARRMAGVSAIILRGNDLYIAQAGPAVVYVEAGEKLSRYPEESDWFVEDAPLIAPQGTASAPLGIRREFVSDLAHASVSASDVFVLATRALTQLATTQELAVAFTERTAQEIAGYLEEQGEEADLTALVAELAPPHTLGATDESNKPVQPNAPEPHIESLPVPLKSLVSLDEEEPPVDELDEAEEEGEWELAPASVAQADDEQELNWDDEETEAEPLPNQEVAQDEEPEIERAPQPVYASAAAALPRLNTPAFVPPPPPLPPHIERQPVNLMQEDVPTQPMRAGWEEELERRRAERAARRVAQQEGISRAVGGVTGTLALAFGAIGGVFSGLVGAVDWDSAGKRTNRFLNIGVGALISFFLLLVRLVLPGVSPRTSALIPRRATTDPVWLKALALVLPIIFIGLAVGRFMVEVGNTSARFETLVAQADTTAKAAEVNPDKTEARKQFNDALKSIRQALAIQESPKAKLVLYRIQDRLSEMDGVAVFLFLPTIVQLGGAQLKQIAISDQDVFLLDGRGRIYKYAVNDATGAVDTTVTDNGILTQVGAKVDEETVSGLQLFSTATPVQDKSSLVTITKDSILSYDLESSQWTWSPVADSSNWGDLRAIANFGGNIYLLDAKSNQIYRYSPTATGYSNKGVSYFPANAQPNLSRGVDMAIDGDVWILNDNGSVQRFRAGTPIAFQLGALAVPLKNPVAIFTRPEVDSLYIADAGNQRIVEFDKNGAFVRQFKPSAELGDVFKNLRDFTVNETKRKLYFINPDAAYMANLPK